MSKHHLQPDLPQEANLTERDAKYLRHAIELSKMARQRGNRPFGAVVVSADDRVLSQAYNHGVESADVTAHAETAAVRRLGHSDRKTLATSTIYASGEPCVMCCGAIFLAGIGRLVFGIDAIRLRNFRGQVAEQKDLEWSCRDIYKASPAPIECIGPALIEEASTHHIGFWKS